MARALCHSPICSFLQFLYLKHQEGATLISHCQETASLMSLPPPASLKRPSKSKPGKIMPMLCQHSHQRNLMCPSGKAHIFAVHPTRHPIPPSGELGSRTLLFGIAAQSAGQSAQTGSDLSDIDFLRLLKSCHPEPPAMQQCEVTLALNLCPGTKNSSPPFSSSGAQTSSAPLTS